MLYAHSARRAVCWMLVGVSAVLLGAAPDGAAMPGAAVSRACANQNRSVSRAPAREMRAAVVCLLNETRGRFGLPGLRQQSQLDFAAQAHASEMVRGGYFGHIGLNGSDPGGRIGESGFRWSAFGEAISTGFSTPARAVADWLASPEHCRIILSPVYRAIGIGVSAQAVRGFANRPGTWTADLALELRERAPSANWAPAATCPH